MGLATAPAYDPRVDEAVNHHVAQELFALAAGKRAVTLVRRRVPVVGGGIGAATDAVSTAQIASYARRQFPDRGRYWPPSARTGADGLGRPRTPAIHVLVRTSASRSTPCSMPSPVNIQTRSSVARLPVALRAYGQPPNPPAEASNVVMPCRRPARAFDRACPYVSWKCRARRSSAVPVALKPSSSVVTWAGVATPIVSPSDSWLAPMFRS